LDVRGDPPIIALLQSALNFPVFSHGDLLETGLLLAAFGTGLSVVWRPHTIPCLRGITFIPAPLEILWEASPP